MKVLGIETSCDETGVAVYDTQAGLLGHRLYSQIELHAEYGGVVPELASRDHVRKLLPLIRELLDDLDLLPHALNGIAYTAGPGLIGALLVGAGVGRSMAWALKIPAIGVHHLEGHLLAPMLEINPPQFPFIALLVSGGHTQLMRVDEVGSYTLLGESVDDAAGEAFDKTAKLLGLGYPGGPALSALAEQGKPDVYRFPRPMTNRSGLDFSFSGLKTFALTTWQNSDKSVQARANIAYAFEEAVVETLAIKCARALQHTGLNTLIMAGGVSANQRLRARLHHLTQTLNARLYYPRLELCTDNGAMIAYAGALRLMAGQHAGPGFHAKARWALTDLPPV